MYFLNTCRQEDYIFLYFTDENTNTQIYKSHKSMKGLLAAYHPASVTTHTQAGVQLLSN
jgi:dihydroorotase